MGFLEFGLHKVGSKEGIGVVVCYVNFWTIYVFFVVRIRSLMFF